VRFRIEQRFTVPASEVVRALTSEVYLTDGISQLSDIGEPSVIRLDADGPTVSMRLEYCFGGNLPSIVTKFVDGKKLSWFEDSEVDTKENRSTFTITPTHYTSYFRCVGTWQVTETKSGAVRVMEGDMKVTAPIPFVGGQVERAIISGLKERLADEPVIMERWLAENPA
jgi:Protein of unknown function (DUF2505)